MPEIVIRFTGKQLKTEDQVKAFEMNDGFIKSRLRPTHGEALGRTYFNEKTQSRTCASLGLQELYCIHLKNKLS